MFHYIHFTVLYLSYLSGNVARGKNSSSLPTSSRDSNVVDGDLDTTLNLIKSWTVDLGKPHVIQSVRIFENMFSSKTICTPSYIFVSS